MMAKNKTADEQQAWRFYRSNLSTIVWDRSKDKPLADFSAGYFTTTDPIVAEKLTAEGYMEIPLDSKEPPMDIIINKPATIIRGDVPIMKSSAFGERFMEEKMKAVTEVVGAPLILKKTEEVVVEKKTVKRKKRKV